MQQFISNLSFPRKFALIGATALLLLALPMALLMTSLAGTLVAAERERSGIAPVGAVLNLVRLTQQHRGMSAGFLAGQAAAGAPRQAKQAEVDAAWGQVQTVLLSYGDAHLQSQAAEVAATWTALQQAVSARSLTPPQSFARHTALVARQQALLRALAVDSGIARHHQLSGYHVQRAVVTQLPELSETMGQLRARANAVLVRGEIGTEERIRLETLVSRARQMLADTQSVLADLRRVEPEDTQRLDAAAAAVFSESEKVLVQAETDIVRAETPSLPAAVFWARITQVIDQQFGLNESLFKLLDAEVTHSRDRAMHMMLAVGAAVAVLLLVGAWLLWVVARGVQRTVGQALVLTRAVAAGDLTTRVPTTARDELGQLLQALAQMQGALATVVGSVRSNADSVATASAQIAQGNLDLSSRTEAQASALQQTAATMDELGSTVRNNADNSRQADQLALNAAGIAIRGGAMVEQVVQTMRGINDSSRQIAEIITVIDGIAFQTNILALNAAVEAARAGEQGRGFAVVASEVRTLAQRSAQAARQIKDLITTSVHRVEQGCVLVDEAGHTMQDIVAAIDRVKGIVSEISSASVEQSQGVAQVGQAVTEMDHATQRNAALVEESAAAAQSLKEQAQLLVTSVAAFRLAA